MGLYIMLSVIDIRQVSVQLNATTEVQVQVQAKIDEGWYINI